MDANKKIIIAAGGTGGHLYPGIALAAELKRRGYDPLFTVKENDACIEILKKEGFPYVAIPAAGLPRKLSPKLFSFVSTQLKGIMAVQKLLTAVQPAVIVGMGGFISFPLIVLGKRRGIPTLIHEQNCYPGLANRILARIADTVALSFSDSEKYFKKTRYILTGNPVRPELFASDRQAALQSFGFDASKYTVLIFGGSLGAAGINRNVGGMYSLLAGFDKRLQFIHVTGTREYESVKKSCELLKYFTIKVFPYLHTIGDAYAAADLIICRAGATTVSELLILNKPAILIPYPYATANHQEFNARVIVNIGQGVMIREKDVTPAQLAAHIKQHVGTYNGIVPAKKLPPSFPQSKLADMVVAACSRQA
jgi:UDP-N-acetylglucosamine--N-acetylmuramyl-(pentapeptide) pyrophosphoryl-undecaprenol N-acetylglucosamine transferase